MATTAHIARRGAGAVASVGSASPVGIDPAVPAVAPPIARPTAGRGRRVGAPTTASGGAASGSAPAASPASTTPSTDAASTSSPGVSACATSSRSAPTSRNPPASRRQRSLRKISSVATASLPLGSTNRLPASSAGRAILFSETPYRKLSEMPCGSSSASTSACSGPTSPTRSAMATRRCSDCARAMPNATHAAISGSRPTTSADPTWSRFDATRRPSSCQTGSAAWVGSLTARPRTPSRCARSPARSVPRRHASRTAR